MTALTQGRNTPRREGDILALPMAASQKIYEGAIVMRNAAGYVVKGATALNLCGVGCAGSRADNSAGAAGDVLVAVRRGVFRFANSAAGDAIAIDDIGYPCFAVDDQTVAITNGTGTRSIAGFVEDVDANGVWVRFDEALVRVYLLGIAAP